MPAKTEKQRRFMGAELERKREGKKTPRTCPRKSWRRGQQARRQEELTVATEKQRAQPARNTRRRRARRATRRRSRTSKVHADRAGKRAPLRRSASRTDDRRPDQTMTPAHSGRRRCVIPARRLR